MKLLKKFNIQTDNEELYIQALTHTSYSNEVGDPSYERLEFLGDAVLELIITEYLYKKDEADEGVLTKKRAMYVCENALHIYGTKLELNDYIRLGRGEIEAGGKERKVIVADVMEAFLGAIFLDKGFSFVKKFVYNNIIPIIENDDSIFIEDFKSKLQELVQTDKRSLTYVLVAEKGPSHDKEYTVAVKIDDIIYGKGRAGSKKEAEQQAAKDALEKSVQKL